MKWFVVLSAIMLTSNMAFAQQDGVLNWLGRAIGDDIVDYNGSLGPNKYRSWKISGGQYDTLIINFKSANGVPLNVYVLNDQNFQKYKISRNFSYFRCGSAEGTLQISKTCGPAKGRVFYIVVENQPKDLGSALGFSGNATFYLTVDGID